MVYLLKETGKMHLKKQLKKVLFFLKNRINIENIGMIYSIEFHLDDALSTELLVKNCADDLKEMQEPWPLHYAAEQGNFQAKQKH